MALAQLVAELASLKVRKNWVDMDLLVLGEISGFIGGTIGIAQGIPQVLRIRRLGHADGVSLSPWILLCAQFAAWFGFGIKVGSPAIYVSNFLTLITSLLVVIAIRGKTISSIALIFGLGAMAATFVILGPAPLVDVVMVLFTASRVPQLIRTWRNRNRVQVTAVSISALSISLISLFFWLMFALLTANGLVIFTTCLAATVIVATAALERRISARAKA
ncbi:MAG: hypothetical protein RL096_805 [Actinomycetota bacterium]